MRDTEVEERATPIGAATGVPSGSGAFAGHALSQGSLTGCPLGPALPEVRCTPGFSRLVCTSVNRLTFKSRAPTPVRVLEVITGPSTLSPVLVVTTPMNVKKHMAAATSQTLFSESPPRPFRDPVPDCWCYGLCSRQLWVNTWRPAGVYLTRHRLSRVHDRQTAHRNMGA